MPLALFTLLRKLEKQYLLLFFILLRSVIYTGNMKQGILKHTKRRIISLIKVQIVTQKHVVQVFFLIMSHHNLEQISEETMIVSCVGVFISPEFLWRN
jgi:hypothetical protein